MIIPENRSPSIEKNSKTIYFKPIKLTGLAIPGNIFLAPLAGYTDAAFRSICVEQGACFTFTEMVSAEAIARNNQKTLLLLKKAINEKLLGVQLFTANYKTAQKAVQSIKEYKPSLIDLNCGCSMPKILKTGAGARLLKEPGKIADIIKAIKQTVDLPVSLKLRSGWDNNSINFLEAADLAIRAGACLITLHPRTCTLKFNNKANWHHIEQLKKNISIPVFGSGDLFSAQDALNMIKQTKCDGVMFARGAIGNPFVFRDTHKLFTSQPLEAVGIKYKIETALKQLKLLIDIKGEIQASIIMRKHFNAYTKGLKNSNKLRLQINSTCSLKDYENIFNKYLSCLHNK